MGPSFILCFYVYFLNFVELKFGIVMVVGIIYCYTSPSGKKYVGQTRDEKTRRERWRNTGLPYGGVLVEAARRKYGPSAFTYEVLERVVCDDVATLIDRLRDRERYWIEELGTLGGGYNLTDGGYGGHHTEETKARLSEMMRGRYVSEETRRKRSLSLRGEKNPWYGKPLPDAIKAKISASLRGRVLSPESIQKIRVHQKTSRRVIQYRKDGTFVAEYPSIAAASRELGSGFDKSNICKCCKGKVSNLMGFVFRYA